MMKLWIGFFILFSCGCLVHSQDTSISIVKSGNVEIIEYTEEGSTKTNTKTVENTLAETQKGNSRKDNKLKLQNHTKLKLAHSRKANPEKNKSPELVYKNLSSDTFFLNSSEDKLSAVLSYSNSVDFKKTADFKVKHFAFSQDFLIKKNTYYYLFSKDTGKLYQFFNKPPPTISFS